MFAENNNNNNHDNIYSAVIYGACHMREFTVVHVLLLNHKVDTNLPSLRGWKAESTWAKLHITLIFVKTNFCLQRDSNLGPLAQQASVLPLDH